MQSQPRFEPQTFGLQADALPIELARLHGLRTATPAFSTYLIGSLLRSSAYEYVIAEFSLLPSATEQTNETYINIFFLYKL